MQTIKIMLTVLKQKYIFNIFNNKQYLKPSQIFVSKFDLNKVSFKSLQQIASVDSVKMELTTRIGHFNRRLLNFQSYRCTTSTSAIHILIPFLIIFCRYKFTNISKSYTISVFSNLVYYAEIIHRKMCQQKQRRRPAKSESASNLKIWHIVNKAGLFHILFGLIKF